MDLSYETLSESERDLFERSAIFSGSFTLSAAQMIMNESSPKSMKTVHLIQRLIEKSLLHFDGHRYEFLFTVREYALQRLIDSGEFKEIHYRHFNYFSNLVATAETAYLHSGMDEKLMALVSELENIHSAYKWLLEQKRFDQALNLVNALWPLWFEVGFWQVGCKWYEEAYSALGSLSLHFEPRAMAQAIEGTLRVISGEHSRGQLLLDKAIHSLQEIDDRSWVSRCLLYRGLSDMGTGQYDSAKRRFESVLTTFHSDSDNKTLCRALDNLANIQIWLHEDEAALSSLQDSLKLARQANEEPFLTLGILGMLEHSKGNADRAEVLYEESLQLMSSLGISEMQMLIYVLMAELARSKEQYSVSDLYLKECDKISMTANNPYAECRAYEVRGRLYLDQHDILSASVFLERGLVMCKSLKLPVETASCLEAWSRCKLARGFAHSAAELFGAVDSFLNSVGFERLPALPMFLPPSSSYSHLRQDIKAKLNDKDFRTALAAGAKQPIDSHDPKSLYR